MERPDGKNLQILDLHRLASLGMYCTGRTFYYMHELSIRIQ